MSSFSIERVGLIELCFLAAANELIFFPSGLHVCVLLYMYVCESV